ncbi:hypothetical protein SAMN04489797_2928 [Winogradskyella sediminis]|uniref:Uncharacterized protein n=1 Tax=Winogradskyella sediminis TaxID=1382466 RepID=A0A1H1WME0_9FLAO|nr:hypothetical protein SAMN04489797_2928 [Winogradskyella sediminis]
MIKNLNELHNLLFNEWKLPFIGLENDNLISKTNSILFNYVKDFGALIEKNNNQDHFEISQNSSELELTNFITENSGNWNIAVDKKMDNLYSNEHWLYTESDFSDFKKLNFGIEECLISFSLQELYFEHCENKTKPNSELNLKPLWINKRYSSNEKTHSFYYDLENKALKFSHSENNFDRIAFIR